MSLELARDGEGPDGEVAGAGEPGLGLGAIIAERYRLDAVLGRGGAATVWRAHDVVLDRAVALKTLLPYAVRRGQVTYERFLREARICAAIRHPNVVGLLDFGTDHERPFLVMELLEGEPLDAKLDREVQLDVGEAVVIGTGILEGLAAAHEAGVVHRDLKPANVFLVWEGETVRPKLLDFGVSRSLDTTLRRSAYTTAEGQLLGTPEYMSPEQARGTRDLDFRTDLYSAGVILFEMLAGILPYESDTLGDLIVEIVTREPAPLSRIRPDVGGISDVLARAMANRRDARFASAREMRDALVTAAEARMRSAPGRRTTRSRRDDPSDPTVRVACPPWEETTIVRPIAPSLASSVPRPTAANDVAANDVAASDVTAAPARTREARARGGPGSVCIAIGLACIPVGVVLALVLSTQGARSTAPDAIVSGPRVAQPGPAIAPEPPLAPADLDEPAPPESRASDVPGGSDVRRANERADGRRGRTRAPTARRASPPRRHRPRDAVRERRTPGIFRHLDY